MWNIKNAMYMDLKNIFVKVINMNIIGLKLLITVR